MKTRYTIYSTIALYLLLALSFKASAQDNNMFYHMSNVPQSYQLNPAIIRDSAKIVLTVPVLTRYSVGLNSTFSLSQVAYKEGRDLVIDIDNLYNTIDDQNSIYQTFRMPILSFQLRRGDQVFSFSVNERQLFKMKFDKELVGLISMGNAGYLNQPFSTDLDFNLLHYRDYSFGYTQKVIPNLTVGGRLKLLTGFAALDAIKSNITLTTDKNVEYLELTTDGEYNTSLPVSTEKNADGILQTLNLTNDFNPVGYATSFSNLGIGIDLGAKYDITPQIEVSASVIDLGMISWKNNLNTMYHKGSYKWEGLDFSNIIDENDPDYVPVEDKITEITDDLKASVALTSSENAFTTYLPTRVYVGGKYQINDMFSAGLVDRILFYDGDINNALTISGNAQFGKIVSLSTSYSAIGNSYNNVGLAAAFKLGPIQLFMVTDNILAITNPVTARHMNASFGFNMMFGQK
ncbi:MAG: DUF5723 family protein [Prolixibacteraceae bacterium]